MTAICIETGYAPTVSGAKACRREAGQGRLHIHPGKELGAPEKLLRYVLARRTKSTNFASDNYY